MTKITKRSPLIKALAVIATVSIVQHLTPALAEDPASYAKMGSPLWQVLSDRQTENLPSSLIPFFVFTDGESLTVAPQAFVANYNVNQDNPIRLVLPGAETIAESDKYPILTLVQFMEKNKNFVNRVTASNPVRSNMLNVYTTNLGNPTTVEHMGRK
jgi:hypothetical protein